MNEPLPGGATRISTNRQRQIDDLSHLFEITVLRLHRKIQALPFLSFFIFESFDIEVFFHHLQHFSGAIVSVSEDLQSVALKNLRDVQRIFLLGGVSV
jgi:hypothetical protein